MVIHMHNVNGHDCFVFIFLLLVYIEIYLSKVPQFHGPLGLILINFNSNPFCALSL